MNKIQEYMVEKYSHEYKNVRTGEVRPLWHWFVAFPRETFHDMYYNEVLVKAEQSA